MNKARSVAGAGKKEKRVVVGNRMYLWTHTGMGPMTKKNRRRRKKPIHETLILLPKRKVIMRDPRPLAQKRANSAGELFRKS